LLHSTLLSDEPESTFSLFHLFTCASWKVKKFLHDLLMCFNRGYAQETTRTQVSH
jgi:hypothetical protein